MQDKTNVRENKVAPRPTGTDRRKLALHIGCDFFPLVYADAIGWSAPKREHHKRVGPTI